MAISKIIIFGANGMLGRYLASYLILAKKYEIIKITRSNLDIEACFSIDLLNKLLMEKGINNTTCVINCIGIIPQRSNSSSNSTLDSKQKYYLVNSVFPNVLATLCNQYGAKYIHPSTDCVFSGEKDTYYLELDKPDETNDYGVSKYLGEPSYGSVIRVSIIGEEMNNKKSFLEWVRNSSGEINGWTNHYWNGITCLEYAKIVLLILEKDLFWNGVIHLNSPEFVSKYDLACMIRDIYQLDLVINKKETEKPINKCLKSVNKWCQDIWQIPSLVEQIKEMKDFKLEE